MMIVVDREYAANVAANLRKRYGDRYDDWIAEYLTPQPETEPIYVEWRGGPDGLWTKTGTMGILDSVQKNQRKGTKLLPIGVNPNQSGPRLYRCPRCKADEVTIPGLDGCNCRSCGQIATCNNCGKWVSVLDKRGFCKPCGILKGSWTDADN
jgi:hypothetical protein